MWLPSIDPYVASWSFQIKSPLLNHQLGKNLEHIPPVVDADGTVTPESENHCVLLKHVMLEAGWQTDLFCCATQLKCQRCQDGLT